MTENEISKAVENLKQCIVDNYKDTPVRFSTVNSADIHTLLTLAEEYLKLEGWPEEKVCKRGYHNEDCDCVENEGFNSAIRLCKLSYLKEKEKQLAEINSVMHIQLTDPSTKTDPYMQGLANGMIMIKSILTKEEPQFIKIPKQKKVSRERIENLIFESDMNQWAILGLKSSIKNGFQEAQVLGNMRKLADAILAEWGKE